MNLSTTLGMRQSVLAQIFVLLTVAVPIQAFQGGRIQPIRQIAAHIFQNPCTFGLHTDPPVCSQSICSSFAPSIFMPRCSSPRSAQFYIPTSVQIVS